MPNKIMETLEKLPKGVHEVEIFTADGYLKFNFNKEDFNSTIKLGTIKLIMRAYDSLENQPGFLISSSPMIGRGGVAKRFFLVYDGVVELLERKEIMKFLEGSGYVIGPEDAIIQKKSTN